MTVCHSEADSAQEWQHCNYGQAMKVSTKIYLAAVQVVVGIVGWSAYTKVQTGSGLPAGPSGLLGAAEGFSYLALLAGIIVFGLNAVGV